MSKTRLVAPLLKVKRLGVGAGPRGDLRAQREQLPGEGVSAEGQLEQLVSVPERLGEVIVEQRSSSSLATRRV